MAKYKLLSQHYSEEDKILEPGTIVGTGTPFKWTRSPTTEMVGLDKESKAAVEREKLRAGEMLDPLNYLPMTVGTEVPGAGPQGVENNPLNMAGQAPRPGSQLHDIEEIEDEDEG